MTNEELRRLRGEINQMEKDLLAMIGAATPDTLGEVRDHIMNQFDKGTIGSPATMRLLAEVNRVREGKPASR